LAKPHWRSRSDAAYTSQHFFAELASLSHPALLPSVIANGLGMQLGGNVITPGSVARFIGDQKLLLILDNCEHVIEAAGFLAETLARSCPG
jgi:predicted ATPase